MSRSASGVRKEIGSTPRQTGSSISLSGGVCQVLQAGVRAAADANGILPRRDKVVTLLDKIRNNRHQID
jgi:hypothetical protein